MSQQIRLEYPGSLWHVTVHGTNCAIFLDDDDRREFLALLARCVADYDWILGAYVLMPREFRLLIKLTAPTLSCGMQWLSGTYAQRFNRRHDRVGHVVHGRFDAVLIEETTYFAQVMGDVVLSPVRAGAVSKLDEYVWSSHRTVLGLDPPKNWLAMDLVLGKFHNSREKYSEYVNAAVASDCTPWNDVVARIYVGSETWLKGVRKHLAMKMRSDGCSRLQRTLCTLTMDDVIAAVAEAWSTTGERIRYGRGGVPRMVAAWIAGNETLISHREVARCLHLRSSARVTRLIGDCDRALEYSSSLRAFVDRSVSTLRRKM